MYHSVNTIKLNVPVFMCHFRNSIINILFQTTNSNNECAQCSIHVKFDLFVGSIFITVYRIKVILCVFPHSPHLLSLFIHTQSHKYSFSFGIIYLATYLILFIQYPNDFDIIYLIFFIHFHEKFISANVRFDEMFSRLRIQHVHCMENIQQ